MIADYHKNEVLPLHRENRADYHDLRNTVQKLTDSFNEFLNVLKGEEKQKKHMAEARDRNITLGNVLTTIGLLLIGLVLAFLTYLWQTRQHASVVGADPSVSAFYDYKGAP